MPYLENEVLHFDFTCRMVMRLARGFMLIAAFTVIAQAQPNDCNVPASASSVTLSLPSPAFAVAPAMDGCWVFVSLTGGRSDAAGVAVVKRTGGKIELSHVVPLKSAPTGITLTHDGKLLIAAAGQETVFLDVGKLIAGDADAAVGSIGGGRGAIYANVTPDDGLLFVSQEGDQSITVIDLERARRDGYKEDAVIGKIPTGIAPIALTFSPDAKWLYTTSEVAPADWNWPKACKPEGTSAPDAVIVNPEGAVVVVDVSHARTDPPHSVTARVPAGCSAVRMAISPSGDRIYVTARNSNAVVAFDTSKLISDPTHSQIAIAPTGDAPVPVAVVDSGGKVITGNSNRFAAGNAPQSLTVLDAAKMRDGIGAVLGIIPAGAFPRELRVSADNRTLFLTNFASNSLQMLDIGHLPINSKLPPEISTNAAALARRGQRKEVVVDPNVLEGYAGVYQIANGNRKMIITRDGDHLTAKTIIGRDASGSDQPLYPTSDTTFYLPFGTMIEFPKIAPGQHADRITVQQPSEQQTRMDDAAAKPILEASAAFAKRLKEQTPAPGSEAAARKLIAALQAGKMDQGIMSPNGAIVRQLPQLQSQAAQFGAIQSITFSAVGPAGPDIYTIKSEKGLWAFRIWLTPDGKIDQASLIKTQ